MDSKRYISFMIRSLKFVILSGCVLLVSVLVSGCSFRSGDVVFFSGTKKLLVCEKPYFESGDCQELNVKNVDNSEFTIYPGDGSQLIINDIFCSTDDKGYKVCQGKDVERNLWDVYKLGTKF